MGRIFDVEGDKKLPKRRQGSIYFVLVDFNSRSLLSDIQ